jgi:hypothetical protein
VAGRNRVEIVSKLEEAGFQRQHLPQKVGGTWVYTEFTDFLYSKGLAAENTGSHSTDRSTMELDQSECLRTTT